MSEYKTVNRTVEHTSADVDAGLRAHMQRVYGLMSTAMAASGLVAYFVGNSNLVYTLNTGFLRFVIMFLPLVMVFAFGSAINRLSYNGARIFFYTFAAAMGLSISWIFATYTDASILMTFASTSVGFLALSLYGYTTKKDISGWGSFLMMGVVGLIVASIINMFLHSGALAFGISIIGIFIFAGLTAYDTQNIKNMFLQQRYATGEATAGKLALYGALQLYLDFINMFMFLLRFMGNQD